MVAGINDFFTCRSGIFFVSCPIDFFVPGLVS